VNADVYTRVLELELKFNSISDEISKLRNDFLKLKDMIKEKEEEIKKAEEPPVEKYKLSNYPQNRIQHGEGQWEIDGILVDELPDSNVALRFSVNKHNYIVRSMLVMPLHSASVACLHKHYTISCHGHDNSCR
jgi:hypothetical protein